MVGYAVRARRKGNEPMIIDMHTHIVPKDFPFIPERASGGAFPSMDPKDEERSTIMISGREYRTVRDVCWDAPKRAAEMAGQGTDKQVLSPLPELLMYHLDPKDGADLARHLNETIAGMVADEPDHFYGLGSAPLQDIELAVAELRVIKELGLHGVEIRSNIEGRSLGEEEFRPFFREAAALGLAVFPHANRPTFADRLAHIPAVVADAPLGFPIESGLAGASIIWSGLLDELPDLRLCISHGGGVLMQLLARSDENWHSRDAVRKLLPRSPMEYASMLYYDDMAFGTAPLRYLIDQVGASQVMIGSDWQGTGPKVPSPEEEFDALGLSPAERDLIGWKNALRYLGEG